MIFLRGNTTRFLLLTKIVTTLAKPNTKKGEKKLENAQYI